LIADGSDTDQNGLGAVRENGWRTTHRQTSNTRDKHERHRTDKMPRTITAYYTAWSTLIIPDWLFLLPEDDERNHRLDDEPVHGMWYIKFDTFWYVDKNLMWKEHEMVEGETYKRIPDRTTIEDEGADEDELDDDWEEQETPQCENKTESDEAEE